MGFDKKTPIWTWVRSCIHVAALFSLLAVPASGPCAEPPSSYPEYQLKALFLFNLAKYVDWPVSAFPETNTTIVIGVAGGGDVGRYLTKVIEGRTVNGRAFALQEVTTPSEARTCHILFISGSELDRVTTILDAIRDYPILTVGETDRFLQREGMVNTVRKDDRIRLEVNLKPVRRAKLTISSRLLGLADKVLGKDGDGGH